MQNMSCACDEVVGGEMICPHGYNVGDKVWCAFNFENECDYEDDPENCRYNQEGITREEV